MLSMRKQRRVAQTPNCMVAAHCPLGLAAKQLPSISSLHLYAEPGSHIASAHPLAACPAITAAVSNGRWPTGNCTGAASGTSCIATCNTGYTGSPTATCNSGAWSTVSGTCKRSERLSVALIATPH